MLIGTYVLSAGYYDAYYLKAQQVRTLIARDFAAAFERCDCHPDADRAVGRLRDRREERRSDRDVSERRVHRAGRPRRAAGDLGAGRACRPTGCRSGCRSSAAPSTRRPCCASARRRSKQRRRHFTRDGPALHRREAALDDALIEGRTGEWEVVIGLEVHAQIIAEAKLFSGAATAFGAEPNTQVSPVDAGVSRHAAGDQPALRRAGGEDRARPRRRDQSVTASSTARTTSTPICRPGYQISQYQQPVVGKGRVDARHARRLDARDRHHPAASRAGRRQEPARPAPERRPMSISTAPASG